MLTRDQIAAIITSFPNIIQRERSNDRLSFEYSNSKVAGKVILHELTHTGNGYVCAKYMPDTTGYKVDSRGWISIKLMGEDELHALLQKAIYSMSQ